MLRINGPEELRARVGEVIGRSAWHRVDQDAVDAFAALTGDHQWIHVDVERASGSQFGGTIVHGYLTLALAPRFMNELLSIDGFDFGVNYGLDRVRFPTPFPVGQRIRMELALAEVTEVPGGVQVALDVAFELEQAVKPACVARWLGNYYGGSDHGHE